jgi:CheY-like chemotaxis protein
LVNLEGKKILYVEDDMSSALLMIELLEEKGIIVTHNNRGQQVLNQFNSKNNYDLILLDIQLPDIDGYEITKQIRKIDKEIPIIAQTAFAMLNEREQILNSGFDDYLSKPIKKEILFKLLEQYLIKGNQ